MEGLGKHRFPRTLSAPSGTAEFQLIYTLPGAAARDLHTSPLAAVAIVAVAAAARTMRPKLNNNTRT